MPCELCIFCGKRLPTLDRRPEKRRRYVPTDDALRLHAALYRAWTGNCNLSLAHHLCATHHFPHKRIMPQGASFQQNAFRAALHALQLKEEAVVHWGTQMGILLNPHPSHHRRAPQHSTSSRGGCERSISFMSCVPLSGFFHTSCSTGISEPFPRITGSTNVRSGIRDIDCDHNHVFSTSHNPHYGSNGN
jgi:hypothetical protein